jgi:RNA polymerase sigma factor (sigma-70 family)
MNQDSSHAGGTGDSKALFQATRWSLILTIGCDDTVQARLAREEFCRMYWHAVYGFVRCRGRSEADAQDLTQEFFLSHLLERNAFQQSDPRKGKFRNFLMTSLRNFLANHYAREQAQKRHPGQPLVPLDEAEQKYLAATKEGWTEDMVFDRQWAMAIVNRAMTRLQAEQVARGHGELFEVLQVYLSRAAIDGEYDAVGDRFKMQNKTVANAVSRLRTDYRRLIRDELKQTLENEQDIEEELSYLIKALSR